MKEKFPDTIPIFPLDGVIYFPKTNLPLNIFEARYLQLVNDCLESNKLMGMVQSKKQSEEVYNVGCLGKISEFKKSEDGRILINLTGIIRFEIKKEISNTKLYREFEVQYDKFNSDINYENKDLESKEEIKNLLNKTKNFFENNGLILNWKEFGKLSKDQQINTLSMIAPISNEEKQKLLETISLEEKSKILSEIIEFYLHIKNFEKTKLQ
tara:strand:+ start:111 stop:743 length:633 start_codon:yes stop_codon:yes gene_type:complete